MRETIHSTVTPRQDELNLYLIGRYLQGRVMFSLFHPSDFPNYVAKNEALYHQAVHGTPEERDVMAAVYKRRTRIELSVIVCLAIVLSLLVRVSHR